MIIDKPMLPIIIKLDTKEDVVLLTSVLNLACKMINSLHGTPYMCERAFINQLQRGLND